MRIRRRWRRLLKGREEGMEGGACFSSGRRWVCMEIGTFVLVPALEGYLEEEENEKEVA